MSFAGCANILGIDNEYVLENSQAGSGGSDTGGESAGGDTGKGGKTSAGGTSGSGGAAAGGSGAGAIGDGGMQCSTDEDCEGGVKCCSGWCVAPQPIVGCTVTGCTPCDVPDHGVAVCASTACDVECNPGYDLTEESGKAVCAAQATGSGGSPSSGGATGAGGSTSGGGTTATGGTTGTKCDAKKCPGIPGAGPFGCCKHDNTCGGTWAPGAACY